jgi:hypothetical protein
MYPHMSGTRCCLLYDFSYLGSVCGGDKDLWLDHVLRLVVAGDMLSGPITLGVFPLFERPMSFVDSLCRGLRFALATRSSSYLG